MGKTTGFFRTWMLPISMATGIAAYLLYRILPFLHPLGPFAAACISRIQPVLIFAMLFLSFCKISPSQLRFRKWHIWLLLIQVSSFLALAGIARVLPCGRFLPVIEAGMLCMICPTATAAAVVTDKLGGDVPGLISYTVLINIANAVTVPLIVPLLHPDAGMSFIGASLAIMSKVFPTLICPALLAWLVRYCFPVIHGKILLMKDAAFDIWAVSLCLAILMTVRAIWHSGTGFGILAAIATVSLLSCIIQFAAGRRTGKRYSEEIAAAQALGQKNTVFAIWTGYSFMDPVSAVAGGFYSIWHNIYNSWQLYRKQQNDLLERVESGLGTR